MSCGSCGTGAPNGCKSHGSCSTGGCNRLNVHDWLSNLPIADPDTACKVIEVPAAVAGEDALLFADGAVYAGVVLVIAAAGVHVGGEVELVGVGDAGRIGKREELAGERFGDRADAAE